MNFIPTNGFKTYYKIVLKFSIGSYTFRASQPALVELGISIGINKIRN